MAACRTPSCWSSSPTVAPVPVSYTHLASGFISIARPLVELGLAPADYPFSCTGISGYSGGGKKMIAEYESADRPAHSKLDAPKSDYDESCHRGR